MSFLGGLFPDKPDERFLDDQSVQEDHRDNQYVGHAIDVACTVYDTMFDALKFVIRGKADVLERMDRTIAQLEKQCKRIVDKYKELLNKLDPDAALSLDLSLDIAKEAFDLLNSNPVLRRYIGEANYWALWDLLAVLSGKGMNVGADISANLKNVIKGTIYALLSMTNGLMHFESYLAQITSFWGYLYVKDIWLPLTDSICPQVTCRYYYKPPISGQPIEGAKTFPNPVPGPQAFAPMPIPIFDYVKYSPADIARIFSYDDPTSWYVLIPSSRQAFEKAYAYWKSNYTNAVSANDILSKISSALTGGAFTVGFGPRNHDYPGGSPLKIGATFAQLDTSYNKSFPVKIGDTSLASAYQRVDDSLAALVLAMEDPSVTDERDAKIVEATGESGYAGVWWVSSAHDEKETAAAIACFDVASGLPEFRVYTSAIRELSAVYGEKTGEAYNRRSGTESPLKTHLTALYTELADDSGIPAMKDLMARYSECPQLAAPYEVYSDAPDENMVYYYLAMYINYADNQPPLYSAGGAAMSYEVDADGELGMKVDGGREPLCAALGIYGDLKGLYPWDYELVLLDEFREKYVRIKSSFHIYYRKDNPAQVIFADRVIQAGVLKYIATSAPLSSDPIRRGSEEYTAYIFPSETCTVVPVSPPGEMFGMSFPSFASLQRVDAVAENGDRFMYDLTRNQIPRYPKYVDPEKWSIMDLIHELWLLADSLAPLCGDGGRRKYELRELLNQFGLSVRGSDGPMFIGQLPNDGQGKHVELEFTLMSEFASRIKKAIDEVYQVREEVIAATVAW